MSTDLDDSLTGFGPANADMAYKTHQGRVRHRNEDSCLIDPRAGLCVVADGVGGQGDGQWASERGVAILAAALAKVSEPETLDINAREEALLGVLHAAHGAMSKEGNRRDDAASGSTVGGIWAPSTDGWITAFNIGDSPVFHFNNGTLRKVSRDHSLFQLWLDGGRIGPEPSKRMIMQAMGISDRVTPHIVSFQISAGDSVLLCTDGIIGALDREFMVSALASAKSSISACDTLIAAALAGPAVDNLTVSVCRF